MTQTSFPSTSLNSTSVYTDANTESEDKSRAIREEFLSLLSEMHVLADPQDDWFSIQNYVCTAEVGYAHNLSAFSNRSKITPTKITLLSGIEFNEKKKRIPLVTGRSPSIVLVDILNGSANTVILVMIGIGLVGDVNSDPITGIKPLHAS